jgi:aryl sulfotransferase
MAHTQSWWPYRQRDNILMLHYADMLADPPGESRHIADFLGITISDEALAQVVDKTSLSAMRERAVAVDAEEDEPQTFRGGSNTFFYKGTNGRWRSVLTEAELAMYERTRDRVLTPDCARWLEQGKAAIQRQES